MFKPIEVVTNWNNLMSEMEASPNTYEMIEIPQDENEDYEYISDYLPRAEGRKVTACVNRDACNTGNVVLVRFEDGTYEAGHFAVAGGVDGGVPSLFTKQDCFLPIGTGKILGEIEFITVKFV